MRIFDGARRRFYRPLVYRRQIFGRKLKFLPIFFCFFGNRCNFFGRLFAENLPSEGKFRPRGKKNHGVAEKNAEGIFPIFRRGIGRGSRGWKNHAALLRDFGRAEVGFFHRFICYIYRYNRPIFGKMTIFARSLHSCVIFLPDCVAVFKTLLIFAPDLTPQRVGKSKHRVL